MKNKNLNIAGLAAIAALGFAGAAQGGVILVDDFSEGEIDISTRTANGNTVDPIASVLGMERELGWEIVQNPFNSRLSIFTAFGGEPGLGIDMGTGNVSTVTLTYDGVGSEAEGGTPAGLNFDAATEGTQSVRLTFLSIDLDVDATVTLTDGSGNSASIQRLLPASGAASVQFFVFDDFGFDPAFDFSDIDRLDVSFNLPGLSPNRDLFLRDITFDMQVPGPGSLALVGLGAIAATGRRRK